MPNHTISHHDMIEAIVRRVYGDAMPHRMIVTMNDAGDPQFTRGERLDVRPQHRLQAIGILEDAIATGVLVSLAAHGASSAVTSLEVDRNAPRCERARFDVWLAKLADATMGLLTPVQDGAQRGVVALKDCDHLLISTVAEEWAKESGNKSRDDIWQQLVTAFQLGELETDGLGLSLMDDQPSNNGPFVPIAREFGQCDGTLTLGPQGNPTEADFKDLASMPWSHYEKLRQQSSYLRTYIDGLAITRKALMAWCDKTHNQPPAFWREIPAPSPVQGPASGAAPRDTETMLQRNQRWTKRFAETRTAHKDWKKKQIYNQISIEECGDIRMWERIKKAIGRASR